MIDDVLASRPLGTMDLRAPSLCVGTSSLGSIPQIYGYEVSTDQALRTLRAVFGGPIRFIDTSNNYGGGEAERRIGAALREIGGLPPDFLLSAKVDPDASGDFSGRRVRASVDESYERLGVDFLPLVFLHDPERIDFDWSVGPDGPVTVGCCDTAAAAPPLFDLCGLMGSWHISTDTQVSDVPGARYGPGARRGK